jgi:hypothetical protein
MVLANKIPYSYEFGLGDEITSEGSTYATGYRIPDAFSIRFIPATTIGNRFTTRSYTLSGIIPLECASLKRTSGSNIQSRQL